MQWNPNWPFQSWTSSSLQRALLKWGGGGLGCHSNCHALECNKKRNGEMEVHIFDIISYHVHSHIKPLACCSRSSMWTVAGVSRDQWTVCFTSLFKIQIFNMMEFLFQPDAEGMKAVGAYISHISSLFICGVADTSEERRPFKASLRELHGDPPVLTSTWWGCFHLIDTVPNKNSSSEFHR